MFKINQNVILKETVKTDNMTPSEQQLILASIARMIQSNQVNSFEDLNNIIKNFQVELKPIQIPEDTYFSELLKQYNHVNQS